MKSTFISYSTQNKEIADKLVEALEKRGLKCYIAPRDIRPGKIYACEIVEAIKNQDLVTVIFSKESNASRYVLCEINSAVLPGKCIAQRLKSAQQNGFAARFSHGGQTVFGIPAIGHSFNGMIKKRTKAAVLLPTVILNTDQNGFRWILA